MQTSTVPAAAISVYNHALELSNKGDLPGAVEEYKKAIQIHPSFVEAYNNMGETFSQMGDSDLAIKAYSDALKISKNFKVLCNLGVEFYNKNDYDRALKFFKDSVAQNKEFIEGNFYAGMIHYDRKDLKGAEKYFSVVVHSDKKHLKANYLLSYIYYEWKQYAKTLECLERIRDISDDKLFFNRYYGFCCYYMGNYKEAVSYLTTALESKPEYAKFRDYLSSLTYENKMKEIGDVDGAIIELEQKLMTRTPDFKEATRLGMLYIFKGENKKAEQMLLSVKQKKAS
jgi:tetratricopeptide (TPR) repeat protein